jgi:hypothetical protein
MAPRTEFRRWLLAALADDARVDDSRRAIRRLLKEGVK